MEPTNLQSSSDLDLWRKCTLEEYKANVRVNTYKEKLEARLQHKEREKKVYDEIVVTSDDIPMVITRNLLPNDPSRLVMNIRSPRVFKLVPLAGGEEFIYALLCTVGNKQCEIYFASSRLLKGNYLEQKLAEAGIVIHYKPSSQKKQLLLQFLTAECKKNDKPLVLPETDGWYETSNREIKFTSKEDLTWKETYQKTK